MKITNTKKISKAGSLAIFTVAEIKKLIEGSKDTDTVRVHAEPYYNQLDAGQTTLTLESTEEV